MTEHFYNPHGEETEEQIAYERELLSQHSRPTQRTASRDYGGTSHERGLAKARALGSSWGEKAKKVYDGLKPNIQLTRSFLSLEARMTMDMHDPNLFPEVREVATVRKGLALCPEEQAFLAVRKRRVRDHFVRYMGWGDDNLERVHPDDVPTVAFGGSGGGYRAMLAFLGYAQAFQDAGLWDLLAYAAGVSGSCWMLGALYTFASGRAERLVEHCKQQLSPHHPLSPEAVQTLLGSARGDYETLGPLVLKHKSGLETVSMDFYAVFTTGYLFMPQQQQKEDDLLLMPQGSGSTRQEVAAYRNSKTWTKWSDAQRLLQDGAHPLPILTAIRHERPWKDWADPEHPFKEEEPTGREHQEAKDAWFQWFEMTPYEIGCDELGAWCPTYAFGRPFEEGKSTMQLPEQSLALLLGLCTSAPAGPLSSYLSTIQRNLPSGLVGDAIKRLSSGVAKMWGKHETSVFENHHPLHASNEHNFLYHLTPAGPNAGATPRPPGIENSPRIHLIDSGMDNNCPTMPLLHPGRKVDVILTMDASSDVQKDSFGQRIEQIGSRRGLSFVKRRRAVNDKNKASGEEAKTEADDPDHDPKDRFRGMYAQVYDGTPLPHPEARPETVVDSYGRTVTNPPAPPAAAKECTVVYLPLLPNERAVPGYDPSTAKFSGSYNLVWTPEQVDMIIRTSVANFREGEDTIKSALFDAWQRKARLRQQRETLAARDHLEKDTSKG
ncbi:cytosolic phospholipase A2 [Apiospora arundinis]